jgi:hypothetical protein
MLGVALRRVTVASDQVEINAQEPQRFRIADVTRVGLPEAAGSIPPFIATSTATPFTQRCFEQRAGTEGRKHGAAGVVQLRQACDELSNCRRLVFLQEVLGRDRVNLVDAGRTTRCFLLDGKLPRGVRAAPDDLPGMAAEES